MELETLLKIHSKELFTYAFKLTKHRQKAEDLMQDTCINIFKGLPNFRNHLSFITWSKTIMKNRFIDIGRRESLRWNFQTEEGDFTNLNDEDTYKDFSEALTLINLDLLSKHITEQQAKILYLSIFQQKTYREIGKELKVATGSVFREIQRVRNKVNDTDCLR